MRPGDLAYDRQAKPRTAGVGIRRPVKGLEDTFEIFLADPAARGGVQAWIGIVCGSLFGLANLALIALGLIGILGAALSNQP